MRRRSLKPKFKTKRYWVYSSLLKQMSIDSDSVQYVAKRLEIGKKVKHVNRDYRGTVVAIDNNIYVLFDNTDHVEAFTEFQFKKLMEIV